AKRESLGSWLYGVAYRTALAARRAAGRRRAKEAKVVPQQALREEEAWRELQPLLDEELSRLPEKYRGPVVLCYLHGKRRREGAREVGVAEGTLSSRRARGRGTLARRLALRGLTIAGAALAAGLCRQAAAATLPSSLLAATLQAGALARA